MCRSFVTITILGVNKQSTQSMEDLMLVDQTIFIAIEQDGEVAEDERWMLPRMGRELFLGTSIRIFSIARAYEVDF